MDGRVGGPCAVLRLLPWAYRTAEGRADGRAAFHLACPLLGAEGTKDRRGKIGEVESTGRGYAARRRPGRGVPRGAGGLPSLGLCVLVWRWAAKDWGIASCVSPPGQSGGTFSFGLAALSR